MTPLRLRTLSLAGGVALLLAACGDAPSAATGSSASSVRATPLAVGDLAPSFPGLPAGKAVVVFYRGHW